MQADTSKPFDGPSVGVSKISATGCDNASINSRISRRENKLITLRTLLEDDLPSADLKWSLFVAACQSYRYDSCLKPFPPYFINGDIKDIDGLREVVDKVPSFPLLLRYMKDPDAYNITSPTIVDLITWVLLHFKDHCLRTIPKSQFNDILNQVHCETPVPPPNFIFQLCCSQQSVHESRWMELQNGRRTLFGFHGSRLENFHSILHHGLQQHLTKNALFGRGIYLSSELSVSLPYSPMGYGWGRSVLGDQMSCVALCEMIDHPDVKCQNEGDNFNVELVNGSGSVLENDSEIPFTLQPMAADKNRALNSDSIGGEVPKKYYVVVNSDLVRVRYLLIYSRPSHGKSRERSGSLLQWLGSHKLLTFIIGYVVLLASVGLSNNHYVQRYYKMMLHRAGY